MSPVVAALVPVWTVPLAAYLTVRASEATHARLPNNWMVLLLLPAVGVRAAIFVAAPVRVFSYKTLCLPILTQDGLVAVVEGLAPQVLPIVRVHALLFVVLVWERAPRCLEVEHVEVRVLVHAVQQIDGQLILAVREGAEHAAVLASVEVIWIALTELGLVLLRVIEFFHPVVCQLAGIAKVALVARRGRGDERAHGRRVHGDGPPPVLVEVVVVETPLRVVIWDHALLCLVA